MTKALHGKVHGKTISSMRTSASLTARKSRSR